MRRSVNATQWQEAGVESLLRDDWTVWRVSDNGNWTQVPRVPGQSGAKATVGEFEQAGPSQGYAYSPTRTSE